ncbi:MAG: cysteine--tRNA ligase [Bacilli bacterium]|jgi:cysteinyl-tRNA synthetase
MKIKLFNSLSNSIVELSPIKKGEVSIYVCGPTVYNSSHIGNMRPVVIFDVLRRFLEYSGYRVQFVSNFTDVDDKIINRAFEQGVSEKFIADKYIAEYKLLLSQLNVESATLNPRVTEYIERIISYIKDLIKKEAAYVADGDVYFRISSIKNYGELSKIKVSDLIIGARIEENDKKESPLDFALWKKTDKGICWNSPWSKGRPGWHTECCVMIDSIFPDHLIDIHGGGFDLKFPHHENEIAQAKAQNGNRIANIWMHNGFVNIDDEKMSKSIGNVALAKDVIARYGGNATRMLMLSAHYRAPVNFTSTIMENVANELNRITISYKQLSSRLQLENVDISLLKENNMGTFLEALADDLNIANAMSEMFAIIKDVNQKLRFNDLDIRSLSVDFKTLHDMFAVLGFDIQFPLIDQRLRDVYFKYLTLKKEKKYEESDKYRQVLIQEGIL